MTDITLTKAQKEEIQKEIEIVKASKTGELYFDKKFNGKKPTETEMVKAMVKANGCGLFALVKWLDKAKDKELKSYIKPLTRTMDNAKAAALVEEITGLRFSFAGEAFQIKQTQSLRKKLDKEYSKKKKRIFEKNKKNILAVAEITDHIDVEKALLDAQRKADETPPPRHTFLLLLRL